MAGKPTLDEFAAANPRPRTGYAAWVESIPEWPDVKAGWEKGYTQAQIRNWLIEACGYSPDVATRTRLAHLSKWYPRSKRG